MKGILWLASYPKSGNTWLRVFLTNYRQDLGEPADINHLEGGPIASDRSLFDEWAGVDASDLSSRAVECLRPYVYQAIAEHAKETPFIKIHDAMTPTPDGVPLILPQVTLGAVYLVRNPLDVAVSLSDHCGCSLEKSIQNMGDPGYQFASKNQSIEIQLPQRLLTWSQHIHSWVDQSGFPVLVVRYEDLLTDPCARFGEIIQFCGFSYDRDLLLRSIGYSSFETLQEQERLRGFHERSRYSKAFFRQGRSGSWREVLSRDHVTRVIQDHGPMMERFGYLPLVEYDRVD